MASIQIHHYKKFKDKYKEYIKEVEEYLESYHTLGAFSGDKVALRDRAIELRNRVEILIESLDNRTDTNIEYEEYRKKLDDVIREIEEIKD